MMVIILFGYLLLAFFLLFAAIYTDHLFACSSFECWFNRYQTYVSGLLALTAGLASVHFLKQQIEQTQTRAASDDERLRNASRAMLPIALSEIAEYAETCIELSKKYLEHRDKIIAREHVPSFPVPVLPRSAFGYIEQSIKYSNPEVQTGLATLIRLIQIQNARMTSTLNRIQRQQSGEVVTIIDLFQCVADALEVDGTNSSFFVYARGGELPKEYAKRTSMLAFGINDAENDDLLAFMSRPLISSKFLGT